MKRNIVLAGSVLPSLAASLCCTGPLLGAVFGFSALGVASALEGLRPYLLGATIVLLASAFYLTYRKPVMGCAEGDCERRPAGKILLWVITGVVIAAAAFPYYSGAILQAQAWKDATAPQQPSGATDSEATAVIPVSGMTCSSCAAHIQGTLAKTPGVKSAEVSYEKGQAVVRYDSTAISLEAIRAAIEAIGYKTGEPASDRDDAAPGQVQRVLAPGPKAAGSQVDSARISFYTVPLVCMAAPEIGCGPLAKPILQELERNPAVAEAWLNRPGTVLAVLWAKGSTAAKRAEAIAAIAKKGDLALLEVDGDQRETALKEFDVRANWYRSSEVDRLSEEEADIIAARLARRVGARITLSGEQASVLRAALADAFKRCVIGAREPSIRSLEEEFLSAGRKHLNEEGVAALKHALSLGIRPLPGEK